MKKNWLKIALGVLMSLTLFASCEKEDNSDGWDKDPLGGEYKLKCHKVIF